jgi:SAM-dependent methyltransferase
MTVLTMTPEMGALKTRLKTTWESGDYGVFAKYLEKGALDFFDRVNVAPGARLLDVACGAGQLTIPAARKGITVTGLDLAANLVQQARARAAEEGLQVRVDAGDAEELPYPDGSFDVAMSLIGAMFAPRPELVASEMIRVCRPGGRIVMGNWTPEGHVGQMFKIIGQYAPPPPFVPSPLLWGDEGTCRQRFGAAVRDLRVTRHLYPFVYPFAPAKVVDFFFDYYGPTNRVYASLGVTREALHAELTALWTRNNLATDGTTHVESEYLEVVATRA